MTGNDIRPSLGRMAVFFLSVKQIVGGGIIALPVAAYAETGPSIVLAFPMATLLMTLTELPLLLLSRHIRSEGSIFAWPARLLSPKTGFLALWMHLGSHISLALYATTAGDTIHGIWHSMPEGGVAAFLIAAVWILNLAGSRWTSRIVVLSTTILVASLALFIVVSLSGLAQAKRAPLFLHGVAGFRSTIALLCFSAGGASVILELGRDIVEPKRNIWRIGLAANAAAGLLYILIALATCGALASTEARAQPLSLLAERVMAPSLAEAFAIATGFVGMIGAMAVNLLWGSRAMVVAADAGYLPQILGRRLVATGAPFVATGALALLGVLPVLLGFDVARIARIALAGAVTSNMISVLAATTHGLRHVRRLPGRAAEQLIASGLVGLIIQGWLLATLLRAVNISDLAVPVIWMLAGIAPLIRPSIRSKWSPKNIVS